MLIQFRYDLKIDDRKKSASNKKKHEIGVGHNDIIQSMLNNFKLIKNQ